MSLLLSLAIALQSSAAPALPSESEREARVGLQRAGTCLARRQPLRVSTTLRLDYRDAEYRRTLQELPRAFEDCFPRGRTSASNLLLAGALAEALIEEGEGPLNARLAAAAQSPAVPRSATDQIAMCVTRSAPDDVANLFATEVSTPEEVAARQNLQLAVSLCTRGGPELRANIEGFRAMLATAAFRLIDGMGATT